MMKYSTMLTALLVLASCSTSTHAQPVTPLVPGPEVEAFKKAQEALMKKYETTHACRDSGRVGNP
jgi:uncharacterized lipoprotein YajG